MTRLQKLTGGALSHPDQTERYQYTGKFKKLHRVPPSYTQCSTEW
jgi:hypothetical protein